MPIREEELYIGSENLIQVTGLKNVETDAYINDATIAMSLFEDIALHPECSELTFDSGGTAELLVGDTIEEAGTPANSGVVTKIVVTSGTWVGGDAAGRISLINQTGEFAENDVLDVVDGQANIADVDAPGPSTGVENDGGKARFHVRVHGLTDADWIRLQGFESYDTERDISAVIRDKIIVNTAYSSADKLTGNEKIYVGVRNATNISLTHSGGDPDGYYDGLLPDTMVGLLYGLHYHLFINIVKGTSNLVQRLRLKAVYSPE